MNNKKTIIVVNSRFLTQQVTGVQRTALEISRQLRKMLGDIEFVAPKTILNKSAAEELNAVSYGNLSGHLWEQTELRMYLRKKGNPVLLNLANTAPLNYKNQIVTIHDMAFLRHPSWFSRTFSCYYKFLIPRISENALRVITVSEFSKKEIISLLHIPAEKIKVIHNAIPHSLLQTENIRSESGSKKYILAVSSMDPRKNIRNLLLSFKRLQIKDIKLIIAGPENRIFADSELSGIINTSDNIVFYGYASDTELAALYRNAISMIYPSLYEGFGLPPLEAMACGCPVIASNTASMPEICGDAAYYVDPLSIESIAEGIQNVLHNSRLREELIKKGMKRVKHFSWEKSAKKYAEILREVSGS